MAIRFGQLGLLGFPRNLISLPGGQSPSVECTIASFAVKLDVSNVFFVVGMVLGGNQWQSEPLSRWLKVFDPTCLGEMKYAGNDGDQTKIGSAFCDAV